jgi:hypothetical protein
MNWKSLTGVTFLSNAELECPEDRALKGLQFEEDNRKKFRYSFECSTVGGELTFESISNPWSAYLGWNPEYADKNGNVNFLDRQTADCTGKGFLASLAMEVEYDRQELRYLYKCAKVAPVFSPKCVDRRTAAHDSEGFLLPALRYHAVSCDDGEYLQKFNLMVDYEEPNGHVWYRFTCCTL